MKDQIIKLLQRTLGYERYLILFAKVKIRFLRYSKKKTAYRWFRDHLPEDAHVVVVGANVGITTLPLVTRFPKRQVFAYEPQPANYEALKGVVRSYRLPNIKTYQTGLSNAKGEMEMILPTFNGVRKQGLAYLNAPTIEGFPEGETSMVEVDRLDDRPELQNLPIDGLKVVAENSEYEVFLGAEQILKEKRPFIYCELWDNDNRRQVLELISQYNYEVLKLVDGELVPYCKDSFSDRYFFFQPNHG